MKDQTTTAAPVIEHLAEELATENLPIEIPEQPKQESPYRIFVSYIVGKDKFHNEVLNTPFEDIDTSSRYAATVNALKRMHDGKRITLLFFKSFEGD
ncbi:hypothetical protein [Mesorhizobium sp. WSM2239]|uniref:Uncharacterized protein n=2 Tax=unclassified Mesorhizobium TaxID=325217 RepID=A0AAU8D276_9HYPH